MVSDLFGELMKSKGLRSHADLATYLDISSGVISRLYHDKATFTDKYILRVHERSGMPLSQVRFYVNN